MGLLRKRIQERKINDKKVYGYDVKIDIKKLFKKMYSDREKGLDVEIFKQLDNWQRENNLDCKNTEHLKLFAKEYLRLKGMDFKVV